MPFVVLRPAGTLFNARLFLAVVFLGYGNCAPAPDLKNTEPNHRPIGLTVYLAIIASLALVLVFLLAVKLHFVQARQSATSVKFKRLYLESSSSFGDTSRSGSGTGTSILRNRSPFWLGFLGSPEKEIGFVASDLLHQSEPLDKGRNSGYILSILTAASQCTRKWLQKVPFKPSSSILGPSKNPMRSGKAPAYDHSFTSSLVIASGPISCPSKARLSRDQSSRTHWHGISVDRQVIESAPTRGNREATSNLSLPLYAGNAESLHLESTFCNPDRRRSSFVDSCNVNAGSGFSTSKVKIEDSRCDFLQELGPVPGGSFLDHLELGSPMPLRFRLPSPLLSFRKASVSDDASSSPFHSTSLPLADTDEPTVSLKQGTISPVDSPTHGIEIEKASSREETARAKSYAHLGLGRPSQSPSPAHCLDKDVHMKISPLDAMLDQLVQATSEWDESVLVDDKFKSLISNTRRSEHRPPLDTAAGANHREISLFSIYDLPEEPEEENPISPSSDPFLEPPYHILRDRTRDLLFPIPEGEAISVSDVVIQRY